jgi:hypothetical protein
MKVPTGSRATPAVAPRWMPSIVLILAAVITASCGAVSQDRPSASSGAAGGRAVPVLTKTCLLRRNALLGPDVPGFAAFVAFPDVSLPVRSVTTHPLWFQRDYVCGRYYGFVITAALKGRYRQQNNATAKAVHYPIGKWPYVPLTGNIVAQLRHRVLEIYEGVYQFRSVAAARAYLMVVRGGTPATPVTASMPGSFEATSSVLGPDRGTDEHVIRVSGRMGAVDVTASLQGGQSLTWRDVGPYWQQAWNRLQNSQVFGTRP